MEHLHDGEICALIGMEIRSMLMDNAIPGSVRNVSVLLWERIEVQTRIDVVRREGALAGEQELAALDVVILEWCRSEAVCERFVESYVRDAEKDGYLHFSTGDVSHGILVAEK